MVFVGGPRQVGKTTLALNILGSRRGDEDPNYLNWDIPEHRSSIMRAQFAFTKDLTVFDEIHKFARWRSLMKGFFDRYYPRQRALITGSARLDYYRRGGDSLLGRYHYYRLHPYSLGEMSKNPSKEDLDHLLSFGGFPEPMFKADTTFLRRWQRERCDRILREDLRDLERVQEITLLEMLLDGLPDRVGSPLSLQSLREDLQVSHDSIRRWLGIFERLYLCFRISPYGAPRIRAVKKEQKLYMWDWSQVEAEGYRFENLVASHLLKYCHYREDTSGHRMSLQYLRDTDKREIDFVVCEDKKPLFAVECKTSARKLAPSMNYFKKRTDIPAFYLVHMDEKHFGDPKVEGQVIPFHRFVQDMRLP